MKYARLVIMMMACFTLLTAYCHTAKKQKLSVSFYSKGAGTNYKKREEFDNYLKVFKKEAPSLIFQQTHWGREGEIDYCINLQSIPKKQSKKLTSGTHFMLDAANLVRIELLDTCKH